MCLAAKDMCMQDNEALSVLQKFHDENQIGSLLDGSPKPEMWP